MSLGYNKIIAEAGVAQNALPSTPSVSAYNFRAFLVLLKSTPDCINETWGV